MIRLSEARSPLLWRGVGGEVYNHKHVPSAHSVTLSFGEGRGED